jgi:chromate transporter
MTRPSLSRLTWLVGRDVNRTFGGGLASMELMRRRFIAAGWLDGPGHAVAVAVSRLTPGTNILAYCVILGWRLYGWKGSGATLVAASLPSALLVYLLTATLVKVDRYAAVQAFLAVAILAAAVLVLASAWHLIRPYATGAGRARTVFITVVAGGMVAAGVPPVRTLLIAAAVGFLMPPAGVERADA